MLALVKRPHIELSLHGEHVEELLAWIKTGPLATAKAAGAD